MARTAEAVRDGGEAPARDGGRNRALGILRLLIVWAFAAALAWFGRPSPAEWAVGLALAALGETIRVWAAGYLVKTKELITGGPYAFVRNPLYLGRLLILGGVGVAARMPHLENLVALALGLGVFFFYYMPRKERVEPARLEEMHGEPYRRYRAAVNSILPNFRRYDDRRGHWSWAHFGKNEEALMVLFLSAFFAVLALHGGVFAGATPSGG
jgi:protein-S-isoprenylcysteine O-methyltransferase Ste14